MTRQVGLRSGLLLLGIGLMGACEQNTRAPGVTETWDNVCVDMDGDGFGFQCRTGDDCDDGDREIHEDCSQCLKPAEGCGCDESAPPVDCRLPYSLSGGGSLLCHTGTRYCRDGAWSGCEGVVTFAVAPPIRTLQSGALLDPSAPAGPCVDCSPDCNRITDPLNTPFEDDAGVGIHVNAVAAGGATVAWDLPPGVSPPFDGLIDDAPCTSDDASDCDGLPSPFDPDPTQRPSGTTHKVLFADLGPASTASGRFKTQVASGAGTGSVDVYLYADSSSSMTDPLRTLRSVLNSGNFLPPSRALDDCADADGDGSPDNANKAGGVLGNIACLVRDVRFGSGWFRDIPFLGPISGINQNIAPWDTELFEHVVDMSSDRDLLQTAVDRYRTRSNPSQPEAAMQGLWALATGGEIYTGWGRPGVPARSGCPANTFGYPCFRTGALPIVVMLTDAPMSNGPGTMARRAPDPVSAANCLSADNAAGFCYPLNYPNEVLTGLRAGSTPSYLSLSTAAEDLNSAEPVGTIDGKLVTYIGNSTNMRADIIAPAWANCGGGGLPWDNGHQLAPDAVFRFHVDTQDTYLISGRGSHFDTTLIVAKAKANGDPDITIGCSDDQVDLGEDQQRILAPEIKATLNPGDYIAVLKGYSEAPPYLDIIPTDKGWFQISFGQLNAQVPGTFEPKLWLGPLGDDRSGVHEALNDRGIRVATIQPGGNRFLQEQAISLATATGATNAAGAAVRGFIGTNGAGLGEEIVRVVSELTPNSQLDLTLDLGKTAGAPNPGFDFVVEAIDAVGDGCSGVRDADGDAVPDTHTDCVDGAKPEFLVTFSNTAAVPPNPDPSQNGGYFMWARVLGNGVPIDRVPVYVSPGTGPVGPPVHFASATYEQEIRANACAADEGPVWGGLEWVAELPPDTRVTFDVCTVDARDQLPGCTFHEAVTIRPGGPCTTASECGGEGACPMAGANRVCQLIAGPVCMEDVECGGFGTCGGDSGGTTCTNTATRIDLRAIAQQALQGHRFGRVRATLVSSTDHTQAPTLLSWNLDYTCAPLQ